MPTLDYHIPATTTKSDAQMASYLGSLLNFEPGGAAAQVAAYLGLSAVRGAVTVTRIDPDEGESFFRVRVTLGSTAAFDENFRTEAAKISALRNLYTSALQQGTGGHVEAQAPEL